MTELLLELFSEEIPALMQKNAQESYLMIFEKMLLKNSVAAKVRTFVGPRRVSIYITELPEFILQKKIETKGPKVTAPAAAIAGFCRVNNIDESDLSIVEAQNQSYYAFIKQTAQISISELLIDILPVAISQYVWPKSMYWGDYNLSWVRPLKNILCIVNEKILPIKFGHLIANNITYGHRSYGSEPLYINNFQDYKEKLLTNHVILEREKKQEIIKNQSLEVANSFSLSIKEDIKLLEEVTGLVEFPQVAKGIIPSKFLELPSEVLVNSMRTHQKYFALFNRDGSFSTYFLFISNIPIDLSSTGSDIVVKGNERVLVARLTDALYFYKQDLAQTLESKLPKLEKITFHAKLGNLRKKTERIAELCRYVAPENESLQMAARLCKSDLTSEMVGEFPELQGIIGYYYALKEGLSDKISIAIRDQYKPQGPSDNTPIGDSAILALADKLDSLVGLILIGEEPTGSRDPYSLRRQALGIIRIILDNNLQLNINELTHFAIKLYQPILLEPIKDDRVNVIISFFTERAKYHFKNQFDISLINAALDFKAEGNIVITRSKLAALNEFRMDSKWQDLLNSYKRAYNILADGKAEGEINKAIFESIYEQQLFEVCSSISTKINEAISKNDFSTSLILLSSISTPLSNFFENIMVKDINTQIANNRLLLIQIVCNLFLKVARFDCL